MEIYRGMGPNQGYSGGHGTRVQTHPEESRGLQIALWGILGAWDALRVLSRGREQHVVLLPQQLGFDLFTCCASGLLTVFHA